MLLTLLPVSLPDGVDAVLIRADDGGDVLVYSSRAPRSASWLAAAYLVLSGHDAAWTGEDRRAPGSRPSWTGVERRVA